MVRETAPFDVALEHLARNGFLENRRLLEAMHSAVYLAPRDGYKSRYKGRAPFRRCLGLIIEYANSLVGKESEPLRAAYHYFATAAILARPQENNGIFSRNWRAALNKFQERGNLEKSPLVERV